VNWRSPPVCDHAVLRRLYRGLCPLCVAYPPRGGARMRILGSDGHVYQSTAYRCGPRWAWIVSCDGLILAIAGAARYALVEQALRAAVAMVPGGVS
jgi:hypothetical protein